MSTFALFCWTIIILIHLTISSNIANTIHCPANQPCFITCNKSNNCTTKIINGSYGLPLTVNCNSKSHCSNVILYCPEISNCSVYCDEYQSCFEMKIYADTSDNLQLIAKGSESLHNSYIYAEQANIVSVYCEGESSCVGQQHTQWNFNNTNIVNLKCGTEYNACGNMTILANYVNDTFNLYCQGYEACFQMQVNAENANNVNLFGYDYFYAFYKTIINAKSATNFSMTCYGGDSAHGCDAYMATFDFEFAENINIACYGFGCHMLDFYGNSAMNSDNVNIDFNGCGICNITTSNWFDNCVGRWHLKCGHSGWWEDFNQELQCDMSDCGCDYYVNEIPKVFTNDATDQQCKMIHRLTTLSPTYRPTSNPTTLQPSIMGTSLTSSPSFSSTIFVKVINCVENQSCFITCNETNNCTNAVINASSASALNLNCDSPSSCSSASIWCPFKSNCYIYCHQNRSCIEAEIIAGDSEYLYVMGADYYSLAYTHIYAQAATEVHILCLGMASCAANGYYSTYVTWFLNEAKMINIKCGGGHSGWEWHHLLGACSDLGINSKNANHISLECNGQWACYLMRVFADNALNVNIVVNDYLEAVVNAQILASQAKNVAMTCYGSQLHHGCYNADRTWGVFDLQSQSVDYLQNIDFNCYGYGCDRLILSVENVLSVIDGINFNGCELCDLTQCVDTWIINYCGYSITSNNGTKCSGFECECEAYDNTLSRAFINDASDKQCSFINTETIQPTIQPTIQSAIYPTTSNVLVMSSTTQIIHSKIRQNKSDLILILILIGSAVGMILIIFISVFICQRKFKSNKMIDHIMLNEDTKVNDKTTSISLQPLTS